MKSDLYLLDCVVGMGKYPDNHFDLAVVDPPYGLGITKMRATSTQRKNRGIEKFSSDIGTIDWDSEIPSEEYFKELFRVSKNQIIWGANYFNLPPTRGIICWDKIQYWDTFSQFELAWTSYDKPASIIRLKSGSDKHKIHPTQKPIKLYQTIFSKYTTRGMSILDTHVGSGSSRIAANEFSLDFTGFEINEYYFTNSENRYNEYLAENIQLKIHETRDT